MVTGRPAAQATRRRYRRDTASPRRGSAPPRNRNSVRTRPMPSQIAGSSPSSSAGSATLIITATGVAVRGDGWLATCATRLPSLPATRPLSHLRPRRRGRGAGSTTTVPRSPSTALPEPLGTRIDVAANADDHRHAAGARQHGDVAGRAAAAEHDRRRRATNRCPRKRDGGRSRATTTAPAGNALGLSCTREMPQHAVAHSARSARGRGNTRPRHARSQRSR